MSQRCLGEQSEKENEEIIRASLTSGNELENSLLVTALRNKIRLCSLQRESIYAFKNELEETRHVIEDLQKANLDRDRKNECDNLSDCNYHDEIESLLMPAHYTVHKNQLAYGQNALKVNILPLVSAFHPYTKSSYTPSNTLSNSTNSENHEIEALDDLLHTFEADAMTLKQSSDAQMEQLLEKAKMKKQIKDMKRLLQRIKDSQTANSNCNTIQNTNNNNCGDINNIAANSSSTIHNDGINKGERIEISNDIPPGVILN